MNIFDRIIQRAQKKKGLYDLHPELEDLLPVLRLNSSDTRNPARNLAEYYASNAWVYKAIKIWADNLSPLDLMVVDKDGDEIEGHPVAELLANPNDSQSSGEFWQEWATMMGVMGEFGVEIVRPVSGKAGKILELWPRHPSNFSVRVRDGRYRNVLSYVIDDAEGDPYSLPPEDFIHIKLFNPMNKWRGIAPLHAARDSVLVDELAQAWTRLFFKNQARPDFAIIAESGMTPTEKRNILLELDQNHGGGEGLHRPIVLEKGVSDIKVFSYPPKDLEWVEQRKMSRDEIGAVFGIPDEIMGYGRDTYENFGTANVVLWTLTLVNLARNRDSALTRFFRKTKMIQRTEKIVTDFNEVAALQEDKTGKFEQFKGLAALGYPVNRLNEYFSLNLPDITGGNIGYMAINMVPIGETRGEEEDSSSADDEIDADADEKRNKFEGKNGANDELFGTKAIPSYATPEHEVLWKQRQSRLDSYVSDISRIVKKEIQRQHLDVARKLRNSRTWGKGKFTAEDKQIPLIDDLFNMDDEIKIFVTVLTKPILEMVKRLGREAALEAGFDIRFEPDREPVLGGITEVLRAVSEKTNRTTYAELTDLFLQAERDGVGIVEIQERLSVYFGGRKADWQTERIARTTMVGATGYADEQAWIQVENEHGVTMQKVWVSALIPDRTRDEHAAAHGSVARLGEPFDVGGEPLMHPGDPAGSPGNVINCLCVMVAESREQ